MNPYVVVREDVPGPIAAFVPIAQQPLRFEQMFKRQP
jgi:hypothetical protein